MRVYRWEETEHHWIAVVRPDELFDLSTLRQPSPEDREVVLKAVHRIHGEYSTYARAYSKHFNRDWTVRNMARGTNMYEAKDQENLRLLRKTNA